MALFGRKQRSDDKAGLLTCMLFAEDGAWPINWMSSKPGGDIAMLRWVRPFAELPTDGLEA